VSEPPLDEHLDEAEEQSSLLSNSAVMAVGTTFSRLSGFLRAALLSYALGKSVHADIFNVANSLPNMLYILLAGGIFNAVLVPQLVRAMRKDPDRGDAYTSRVVTVAALFLIAVTVVLVAGRAADRGPRRAVVRRGDPRLGHRVHPLLPAAGLLLRHVRAGRADPQRRGSFGPMMWAPIANNVISIVVVLIYIVVYGQAEGDQVFGGFSSGQQLLLGLGSTLGIAVQLLILFPFLRRSGFFYTPRLDLRGSGLGHTLRPGDLDGAVRGRQPGRVRRGPAAGHRRRGRRARRHGLHDLLELVPGRDGPALDRHGLARDRDAAPALGARRRR
jgi:putative peptidoglycan lipid II flippase